MTQPTESPLVRYRFELADGFFDCPEVLYAGNEAVGVFVLCATWSTRNKTPGRIPCAVAASFGEQGARRLTAAGMWYREGREYVIRGKSWYWRFVTIRRREAILDSLRGAIYARDGHCCVFCGSADDLTLDHIYPKSLGGEDTEENLQTLCRPCNSSKGARV